MDKNVDVEAENTEEAKQAAAAFNEGYQPETPAPEAATDGQLEAPPEKVGSEESERAPDPALEPVPEFVQIKKADFDRMMAAADKVDGHETQLSKAFGSLGNVNKLLKELQSATPKGEALDLSDEAFAVMAEDFPELTDRFKTVLRTALKGRVGTGEAPAATPDKGEKVDAKAIDPDEVSKLVEARVAKREMEALDEEHEGWREIVGVVDAEGKFDPNNEFRVWLGKQSDVYQARVNDAQSASVISKAIDKFKADKAAAVKTPTPPPDKKVNSRRERINDAIQPKGDGSPPPPAKTEMDAFNEGYSGR